VMRAGKGIHARTIPGTYVPVANRDNDYLMDRAAQKAGATYSGAMQRLPKTTSRCLCGESLCETSRPHKPFPSGTLIARAPDPGADGKPPYNRYTPGLCIPRTHPA
jgi:hypothetical protein